MKSNEHTHPPAAGTSVDSTCSTIDNLIQELSVAKDIDDLIKILLLFKEENSEVTVNMKAGLVLYHNYYINMPSQFGKSFKSMDNMQYLQDNGYCPTAAPEFVGMPISEDGKSCVLITKINDSAGGDLRLYCCSTADEW